MIRFAARLKDVLKSRRNRFALLAVAGLIAVVVAIRLMLFETRETTILNANPYPCVFGITYQSSAGKWQTMGWMRLAPGERKTVSATFYRIEPQFFVAAESYDAALLKWLLDTDDGLVHFKGADVTANLPKNREIDAAQTDSGNVEFETIKFLPVDEEEIFVLTTKLFEDAIIVNEGAEVANEEAGFELIREKAVKLFESLHRQKQFDETFKSEKEFPFAFEFNMTDTEDKGFMYLGVTLTNVMKQTLHGDEIQLRDGDVLIGLGSGEDPVTPIYAPADAYLSLHEHAMDPEKGGITKPLHFVILRGDEVLQIDSYFLFSPAFPWEEISSGRAVIENSLNSLLLGFWAELSSIGDEDPRAAWKKTQQIYRMRQFHPGASTFGEILGFLAPTPTKFLRIGKWARGGTLLTSTMVRGISIELLRVAIYTYKVGVSGPKTERLTLNDLRRIFPTAGISFVRGSELSGKEPSFRLRVRGYGRKR